MENKLTRSASKKLDLHDIVLHSSSLTRNENYDPLLYPYNIEKVSKLQINAEVINFIDELEKEINVLRTYISLGVKGLIKISQESNNDESIELFNIEAIFRVDYVIKKELSDEEIKEFSTFNAVHNAWPFWRQHVFNMANNAKLPRIVIPFFRRTLKDTKNKKAARPKLSKKRATQAKLLTKD